MGVLEEGERSTLPESYEENFLAWYVVDVMLGKDAAARGGITVEALAAAIKMCGGDITKAQLQVCRGGTLCDDSRKKK